jgi:hypothetical protein
VAEGFKVKTEAQAKTGTITPHFRYVSNDSDKLSQLLDLLRASTSEKGNMFIYVKGAQRLKFLQEFYTVKPLTRFPNTTLVQGGSKVQGGRNFFHRSL